MSKCYELLDLIDFRTLDKEIVAPCMILSNSYQIVNDYPQNYDEFCDECTNFYKHLYGNFSNLSNIANMNESMADGYARDLVEKAFNGQGGSRTAFEKAKLQSFGIVKNEMTKAFIKEVRQNQISVALSRFGKYSNEEKAEIVKDYLKLINSPELSVAEFWEKVHNFEAVFHFYIQEIEQRFYNNLH